ncbi:hypothetical protein C8J95_11160 [Elizabethkingia sp. YR214]|uniref:hypothetical protein n=1 Tax=Elizabethkingia sp. YR214 TaxID=2135667 RepID=UPI000D327BD6|nr:hypothetical protein [Elizabethkingia sp. YR214]PUB26376.1 hypothetical protein C8J95_11160 [Elizabethkingia sp. YR214]
MLDDKKTEPILQIKKEYVKPLIKLLWVEMENGIAAQSASLNPGDINSPGTPKVEDWNDGGSLGNKDFDL